jgi:hypothetical protein
MLAFVKQLAKFPQDLFDSFDITRIAIDQKLISASTDAHVEKRFEILDILILDAEKRVKALWRKFEFS